MDDDLLADLEDLGEDEVFEEEEEDLEESTSEMENRDELDGSLASLTKVFRSQKIVKVQSQIEGFIEKGRSKFYNSGPVESDPEYQTIVEANYLTVEIIHEIGNVTKVGDLY